MPMATDIDRKDLPLTRVAIERATQQERLSYGAIIADLRAAKGITQGELEDRSGVTSRTIRNVETGAVAGQSEKLISLFLALGVDIDGDARSDVEPYLAMIAPLLMSIDPDHRLAAVTEVIPVLTQAVRLNPHTPSGGAPAPVDISAARRASVGGRHQDLEKAKLDTTKIAASKDNTPIDPDRGEA